MQGSVASPPGSLLALSPEILSQIFAYLDPVDVARAGQVCRKLARLIDPRSNGVLWRTLFHTLFDPLDLSDGLAGDAESLQGASTGPNGRSGSALYAFLVQQRCNVRGLIHCADTSQKVSSEALAAAHFSPSSISPRTDPLNRFPGPALTQIANRSLVLHTLCDILDSAASSGTRISRNAIFLDSLLCSSATSVKDWLTPEANDPRPYSEAQLERPRRRQRTPQQFPAAHEDVVQQAENPPNGVHVANETSESLEDDASATLCTEVQLTTDLGEGFHADADSDEISPSSEPLSPTLSDHLLKGKAEVRPLPNAADTSDASSEQADSSSSAGSKAVESGLQALTELWAAKDDYPTLILDEYSSRPAHAHPDQASSEPSQSSDFPKRNKMKKTDTADAGLCVASSRGSLQVADDGAPATQMLSNASTTKRDDKTQDSGARQRGVLTRSAVSSSSDDSASSVLALSPAYAATTTPKSDYKRPSRKRRRGPSDAVKSLPMLINADPELKALSCKLHAAGTNFREVDWTSYASACRYREIVYRSSTWTASNMYGPFRRTGGDADSWEVDWVLLDAIVRVLAAGVKSAWHQVSHLSPYRSSNVQYAPVYATELTSFTLWGSGERKRRCSVYHTASRRLSSGSSQAREETGQTLKGNGRTSTACVQPLPGSPRTICDVGTQAVAEQYVHHPLSKQFIDYSDYFAL